MYQRKCDNLAHRMPTEPQLVLQLEGPLRKYMTMLAQKAQENNTDWLFFCPTQPAQLMPEHEYSRPTIRARMRLAQRHGGLADSTACGIHRVRALANRTVEKYWPDTLLRPPLRLSRHSSSSTATARG